MWVAQKLWFLKSRIWSSFDTEPPPLSKWSSESPFRTWNMHSKAFLAASILLFAAFFVLAWRRRKVMYSKQLVRRRPATRSQCAPAAAGQLLHTWLEGFALFLVLCMIMTLPWEWVRLYQIEVAKKMAVLSEGFPNNCNSENLSLWGSFKVWLSWHFAWESDSCENYHRALVVDPFWEVTPLMAVSSVVGRIIVHPLEHISQTLGRSLRNIMKEVPGQWQPIVFLLMLITCVTFLAAIFHRGRLPAAAPTNQKKTVANTPRKLG